MPAMANGVDDGGVIAAGGVPVRAQLIMSRAPHRDRRLLRSPCFIAPIAGQRARVESWTSSAIWTRLAASSLDSSRDTCAFTVGTLMCSWAAMSALA